MPDFDFDERRLEQYLRAHVEGFRGPVSVSRFAGGQSNPTYLLATPAQEYVLRRKPPGQLLASAHAVDREYRVISALSAHTAVPVPRTYCLCTDESVIGTWFYVMERIRGRTFADTSFPEVPRAQRAGYFDAMNAVLAALHGVDAASIGLADYGKPSDYVRRQIARWSRQYREDEIAGRVPAMDRLIEWLVRSVPAVDETAIVHGDFRCDNLMFDATQPRVIAILDWELSTLGHPLADFGYHVMMYRLPPTAVTALGGVDLQALNIPSEEEYVAAYCARTGRASIPDLDFFVIYNMFKMAAICHGIRGRLARGTAASSRAQEYANSVERIAEVAWAEVERGAARAGGPAVSAALS